MTESTVVHAQKLHSDILLKVAVMNADMFMEPNALQITRRTSQVCQQWRETILSASSIWAKLLDMDSLKPNDIWWMEELLRRSGQSLLWIKAESGIAGLHQLCCLLKIMDENWQRLENITVELRFDGSTIARMMENNFRQWLSVTRRAPNLQVFNINFWPSKVLDEESAESFMQTPIFSGYAPKLEFFNSKGYRFSSQAPWLKNLSCLKMDNMNTSISEILVILENAQNLHHLVILTDYDIEATSTTPLPVVSLPKLDRIELGLPFKTGIVLLNHLDLPPSCSLNYQTQGFIQEEDISEEEIVPYISTLAKFARRYFQSHKPTDIEMLYYGYSLELVDKTSKEKPKFRIAVAIGTGRAIDTWFDFFGIFLRELSIPEFSSVTKISLNTIEYHNDVPPIFLPLLKCTPSVQVLNTNSGFLALCMKKAGSENAEPEDEPQVLLPILDTVNLRYPIYNQGVEACVTEFVDFRLTHGKPIQTLTIAVIEEDTMPSVASFERFTGLKVAFSKQGSNGVILKQLEHTCGSDELQGTVAPQSIRPDENEDEDKGADEEEDEDGGTEGEEDNEEGVEDEEEGMVQNLLLWVMMALHELIDK